MGDLEAKEAAAERTYKALATEYAMYLRADVVDSIVSANLDRRVQTAWGTWVHLRSQRVVRGDLAPSALVMRPW